MAAIVADPIRVTCSCGRRAKVSGRLAGRRVRCGDCGAEIRIPGSSSSRRPATSSRDAHPSSRDARPSSRSERPPTRSERPASRRADPYAPPKAVVKDRPVAQRKAEAVKPEKDPVRYYRRNRTAEEHIQALGTWYQISGVLGLLSAIFVVLLGLGGSLGELSTIVTMIGVVSLALCFGSITLGSALREYQPWARYVAGGLSALAFLSALVGIVFEPSGLALARSAASFLFSGACLWAYFGPGGHAVFSPGYDRGVDQVKGTLSPFFYMPWIWAIATGVCTAVAARGGF